MKPNFFPTERGQALIIISLAAIGLFAIVGLAIDVSAKLSDRRNAQNAADTAALAAALARVNSDPQWKLVALDRALGNGYNNDLLGNNVRVYACDESGSNCGADAGNQHVVKVVITTNINTYFSRAIGINQTHNTVDAFAQYQEPYNGQLYNGGSVIGLAPDQCETIYFSGNARPTITGGGVFSNSNQDCGVRIQGSTNIAMSGAINMVAGNYTKNGNPPLSGIAGGIHGGSQSYPYPPPAAMLPDYTCDWSYSSFPPSGVTTLSPGTYCVNGSFRMNAHDTLSGTGVTIVMESGSITWNGGATINLSAPTSGDLAGMLLYAPMSNTNTMILNGNGSSTLTGTFFMPAANIQWNGTGNVNPSHVQIIGYKIELTGSNNSSVLYQDGDNWDTNVPGQVGLMR